MLDQLITPSVARETPGLPIIRWPIGRIDDNPYQPRRAYDMEGVIELAESIRDLKEDAPATSGLQQIPMARLMRYDIDTKLWTMIDRSAYSDPAQLAQLAQDNMVLAQLCFGHRRLRAWRMLAKGIKHEYPEYAANVAGPAPDDDYKTMPLLLTWTGDLDMWRHAITENSQRKDITAIEEAASMRRVMDEYGLTTEEAAKPFGYRRSTAANKLRLLDLPDYVQDAILDGRITEKHGRLLLPLLPVETDLKRVFVKLVDEGLSTRQVEEEVKAQMWRYDWMPAEKTKLPTKYGSEYEVEPPFPIDWDPGDGLPACADCPARILFSGEPAPRCTDKKCAKVKEELWQGEARMWQRDAVSTGALARGNYAGVPLLAEDRNAYWNDSDMFRMDDEKDSILIESGACGPHCACFVAQYAPNCYWAKDALRPDPENAPDVIMVCTDRDARHAKVAELREEIAAKAEEKLQENPERLARHQQWEEERRQREETEAASQAAMEQAVARYLGDIGGLDALWQQRPFLIELYAYIEGGHWGRNDARKEAQEMGFADLQREILAALVATTREREPEGNAMIYGDQFQRLMDRLRPRPDEQPKPGDSQRTQWESGWTDDDQAEYDALGDGWSTDRITRSLVALRLIEEEEDKDLRATLWRRYNELCDL